MKLGSLYNFLEAIYAVLKSMGKHFIIF